MKEKLKFKINRYSRYKFKNKPKKQVNQSKSRVQGFSGSLDVQAIDKKTLPKNTKALDQSKSNEKILLSHKEPVNAKRKSSSGQKTSSFRNPSLDLEATNQEEHSDSSDTSGDGSKYHTECWPSTGDRRGNPKSDFDKHGNRRQKRSPPKRTQKEKKREMDNEFGDGSFWNRPAHTKRKSVKDLEALSVPNVSPRSHDLIVDTGASHVLFQAKHRDLLTNVQLSKPNHKPFAILRAANGQMLKAIGRGIFTVKSISVVAYIFNDEDLVHNLLG